jgi:uncharacterized protein (DUF58 family)
MDPELLRRIEQLSLAVRRTRGNVFSGDHASARHGHSIEFADYRNYSLGDDFRHIDWNAYGRLEKLFLKMFREETELAVYVVIDRSASMDAVAGKFDYARAVAAALGYIALCNCDRLLLAAVDRAVGAAVGPLRGKMRGLRCFEFLERLTSAADGDLAGALEAFARARNRRGLCLVISDFLQDGQVFDGLKALRQAGHDVFAIQVLGESELHPELAGDLRLVDSETGATQDVTVDGPLLEAYRVTLKGYVDELAAQCRRWGMGYALAPTSRPLPDLLMDALRRERLLR